MVAIATGIAIGLLLLGLALGMRSAVVVLLMVFVWVFGLVLTGDHVCSDHDPCDSPLLAETLGRAAIGAYAVFLVFLGLRTGRTLLRR